MISDKFPGFWIKNCDYSHCEAESIGAEEQNRLLESSKILKEQSSKHFLEQASCFYVCQMNNKHCYAHKQVCRLGIIEGWRHFFFVRNVKWLILGSLEKIVAFSSHGFLLLYMVIIWGIWHDSFFYYHFLKCYWEKIRCHFARILVRGYEWKIDTIHILNESRQNFADSCYGT